MMQLEIVAALWYIKTPPPARADLFPGTGEPVNPPVIVKFSKRAVAGSAFIMRTTDDDWPDVPEIIVVAADAPRTTMFFPIKSIGPAYVPAATCTVSNGADALIAL